MNSRIRHKVTIEGKNRSLPKQKIIQMILQILDEHKQAAPWAITLVLTDDSDIIDLNRRFFQKNSATDVISFNLTDADDACEGEIYISIDTAAENAQEYGVTLENELCRLAAHGVLHLLGYEDLGEHERQKMTELENKALEYVCST